MQSAVVPVFVLFLIRIGLYEGNEREDVIHYLLCLVFSNQQKQRLKNEMLEGW